MLNVPTRRLALRPFRLEDAAAFAAYRSDPEVARYQSWNAPYPLEAAAELIASMVGRERAEEGEWNQVAVDGGQGGEADCRGVLVGDCAFKVEAGVATVGFTMARGFWGRGYATEAAGAMIAELFAGFGVERVRAECDERNGASRRVLERLGMERERWYERNVVFKGEWVREIAYSMGRGPGSPGG